MNRTDRLVAMVMYLQGRRVVTADELAKHFEVTIRTIYRDVVSLCEAGVPVAGEAGVGYSLVKGYHLPPVMFTAEEAMALFVGAEMVRHFGDASTAEPMDSALLKIRSVLPRERQDDLDRLKPATAIYSRPRLVTGVDQRTLLPVQRAIVSRRVLRMSYQARGQDGPTTRDVEPLGVAFHTAAWYLVAWCRMRQDFRSFRLDRLQQLEVLTEKFEPRPDFSLREYLGRFRSDEGAVEVRAWFSEFAIERVRRESGTMIEREEPARGGVDVQLRTFSLEWFARWLLSFGPEAEALAPEQLRQLVCTEAQRIAERHQSPVSRASGS